MKISFFLEPVELFLRELPGLAHKAVHSFLFVEAAVQSLDSFFLLRGHFVVKSIVVRVKGS